MCVCMCVCDAFLLASISSYISKVRSHFWLKFGVVPSIYGALLLLNFCGDRGRGLGARTKLLLFITEGKYWNQLKKFRKFRVVLSSGSYETGSTAKKVTASDSAKPVPHIHIIFFESGVTGKCRNGDKE